jgi:hypothetical protein
MVIHRFLGIKLVDPAISHDDPASWRSHNIAVGRHFDGPTTPLAAQRRGVPGLAARTSCRRTDYQPTQQRHAQSPSKFAFMLRRPRWAPTYSQLQRINSSIKLRVVAQVPFHPAGFVIATLSNRSQTISRHFLHSTGWKERPSRDVDAGRVPNRG